MQHLSIKAQGHGGMTGVFNCYVFTEVPQLWRGHTVAAVLKNKHFTA